MATTRQAVQSKVVEKSAHKVCQLIGDKDYETREPTRGLTEQRFGVGYTDLGYPVVQGSRTWFFFGDVTGSNDVDPLGFTDETPATSPSPDHCPLLEFTSPQRSAAAQAVTLDGRALTPDDAGFSVPTGVVFDPDGRRLLGLFTRRLGSNAEQTFFAQASIDDPKNFTTMPGVLQPKRNPALLVTPNHFIIAAPWIVDEAEVRHIPLPGTGAKVLLVWGSGQPYRGTGMYLAAVRLDHASDPTMWRYFVTDPNDSTKTKWDDDPLFAVETATGRCAGELSVSFDPTFKEWRMTHGCTSNFFNTAEVPPEAGGGGPPEGDPRIRGVTVLRTADRPEGPWSAAKMLYLPKRDGLPEWADEGPGLFFHIANQRVYLAPDGTVKPIEGDPISLNPAPPCAESFPSYCPAAPFQDFTNRNVGCCTRSDRCCDFAFDQIGSTGTQPHFSFGDGTTYAPFLIPSFTENTRDPNNPSARFPIGQRVFWTASTLNPYVVDLMATDLAFDDYDDDGVPNAEDICPITPNSRQVNCNEHAEDASRKRNVNVATLGDACDPVPCARGQMDTVETTHTCKGTSSYSLSLCSGRDIKNVIKLDPIGPRQLEDLADRPHTIEPDPLDLPILDMPTQARFCQHNVDDLQNPFDCQNADFMVDAQLNVFTTAESEEQDRLRPWHRITLSRRPCSVVRGRSTCVSFGTELVSRNESFLLTYGSQDPTYKPEATWHYDGADPAFADLPFWHSISPPRIPDGSAEYQAKCKDTGTYGPGTCLDGRIWLHTETDIGKNLENASVSWTAWTDNKGVQRIAFLGHHGEDLANHYITIKPDEPTRKAFGGLRARQMFLRVFTLPDPWPAWRTVAGASLPLIREDGQLKAVFDDGHREDASFIATDALRSKLLDASFLWVSPAEASPYVGGRARPQAIGLSEDGTTVLSAPTRLRTGVLGEEESPCAPGSIGCEPALRTSASSSRRVPNPRRTFVPVYSRQAGRLFLVGGRDATTNEPVDEVWTYRLEDGLWDRLALKGWLAGEVIAATYSWRDGCLWILVRNSPSKGTPRTRLVRLEIATGDVQEIASATDAQPRPRYDTRGVFLDGDGNVGLYASSENAQKHRIAILSRRAGGYDVKMTLRRDRHLSADPIIDLRGVALYYEPDRPPTDHSNDPADDPERGDRTRAASRLLKLPLRPASNAELSDLLR